MPQRADEVARQLRAPAYALLAAAGAEAAAALGSYTSMQQMGLAGCTSLQLKAMLGVFEGVVPGIKAARLRVQRASQAGDSLMCASLFRGAAAVLRAGLLFPSHIDF